jgi:hypothetical protein
MRKLYFLAVLVAGLAFSITACSSDRYYRDPYRGHRYERSGYGYNNERIRQLAYDLVRTTAYLKEEVKHNGYDYRGSNDLKDRIGDFHHEAGEFLNSVNHNRDLRKSDDEFRDMQKRYAQARNLLQGGYGYGGGYGGYNYLYRDFDRANQIMSELSRYYGYSSYSDYCRY